MQVSLLSISSTSQVHSSVRPTDRHLIGCQRIKSSRSTQPMHPSVKKCRDHVTTQKKSIVSAAADAACVMADFRSAATAIRPTHKGITNQSRNTAIRSTVYKKTNLIRTDVLPAICHVTGIRAYLAPGGASFLLPAQIGKLDHRSTADMPACKAGLVRR
jgi:hypothetical protein